MANLVSRASGNWLDASTWKVGSAATGAAVTQLGAVTAVNAVGTQLSAAITGNGDVVEGVLLRVGSRNASITGGNTLTVWLRNTTDSITPASCTMLIADINVNANGWYYFKFNTTATLTVGKSFAIGLTATVATQVGFYRGTTTTDWTRVLVTTTTQAPVAADRTWIVGEVKTSSSPTAVPYTVTMNETATTDYGECQVSQHGTLKFPNGTTTNLRLSGNLGIGSGGILEMGTALAPATGKLEFNCASHGQYGILQMAAGVWNAVGQTLTYWRSLLNASAAASQADLTLADPVAWVSGDVAYIPSTSRTSTQWEKRTVLSTTGNVVTATSNLTNAHNIRNDGTYDTRSYVVKVTRSFHVTAVGLFNHYVQIASGSTTDLDWIQFSKLGSQVANQQGFDIILSVTGSITVNNCSFHDTNGLAVNPTYLVIVRNAVAGTTCTFDECAFCESGVYLFLANTAATVVTGSLSNSVLIGGSGFTSNNGSVHIGSNLFTFTSSYVSSCVFSGVTHAGTSITGSSTMMSGIVSHSNGQNGIWAFGNNSWSGTFDTTLYTGEITQCRAWYNGVHGLAVESLNASNISPRVGFRDCIAFGNATGNFRFDRVSLCNVMVSCTSLVGIDFTAPRGVIFATGAWSLYIINSFILGDYATNSVEVDFAADTGDYAIYALGTQINNSVASKIINNTGFNDISFRDFMVHTYAGAHSIYTKRGVQTRNTAEQYSGTACKQLTPNSATFPLLFSAPVGMTAAGAAMAVKPRVKKDASFNGSLVVNLYYNRVLLDTITPTLTTSYQELTLSILAAEVPYKEGVELEFVTLGTAGSVFVDDITRA